MIDKYSQTVESADDRAAPLYWTRDPAPAPFEPLAGQARCDVAIVGGGLAGTSAALALAGRGYRVRVLEAERVGSGASGRNGGQVLPGFAAGHGELVRLVGAADARRLWDLGVAAVAGLRARIGHHAIDCDWRGGHIQLALKPRHVTELRDWHRQLTEELAYPHVRLLDRERTRAEVASGRYLAGLVDDGAGHLDPLRLLRGLVRAAVAAGARFHEHSRVIGYAAGARVRIRTGHGELEADHVLFAGNALLGATVPALARRLMSVATSVVATEPLGEARARALLPGDLAAADLNWVLDYFRRSADDRLIFGGRISYSGRELFDARAATRRRLLAVFPQLHDVRLTHAWSGLLDITLNRAPDFGRLAPNVWYLQGFSGHGVALTGLAGELVAEAIAGQSERFDLFARIPHRPFPGGAALRRPALVLAMLWYRLRDLL